MKSRRTVATYRRVLMLAVAVSLVPTATLWADTMEVVAPSPPSIATVQSTYGKLPLSFEANQGQVDAQVTFLARGPGYTLFLTPSESVLVLHQREPTTESAQRERGKPIARPKPPAITQAVVRMTLDGGNPTPAVDGTEPLPGIVNYFIGNDPAKWRTHIPTYAKVQYQEVYPGIDLAYYGNQGKLEYDFIVAPGADPDQIRLAFEGASDIHVADSGDLLLATDLGDVRIQKPVVYQLDPDGHKTLVAGQYLVERQTTNLRSASNPQSSVLSTRYSALPKIGIQLAAYDRTKPLVIDPVVLYSTCLGGSGYDWGGDIAVDGSGQVYVTGITESLDFPTLQASQPAHGGGGYPCGPGGEIRCSSQDAFVTKFTASGTLAYSTYLGGSGDENGNGIAVDGSGQAYVTGLTGSGDFPILQASQPAYGGNGDAFVTKFTAAGALAYSTYLGGSEAEGGGGIAVDGSGQVYVTGGTSSGNFPTLHASQPACQRDFEGSLDAFVTKLSASVTNQPPVCRAAQANPAVLWAPNHQLVPIAVTGVTDPEGHAVTITVTGVTQDEPVNAKGDGHTSPDAVIQAGAASVRAERSGKGNGRIYRIAFTADDGHGSSCGGAVTVGVPHSLHKGTTAIDDGQVYDSTVP